MSNLSDASVLPCGHRVVNNGQTHYCTYIKIADLEKLITPHDASGNPRALNHHDELQFVAVHQICEIAFFEILFELRRAIIEVRTKQYAEAVFTISRVNKWVTGLAQFISLLDTMPPRNFAGFRDPLPPASGAESKNFRFIEILSGLRADSIYLEAHGQLCTYKQTLTRSFNPKAQTSWWTEDMESLAQTDSLALAYEAALAGDDVNNAINNQEHPLYKLTHALIEYEEAFLKIRQVHIRTAAKALDVKVFGKDVEGSGGEGVPYLQSVLNTARFFPLIDAALTSAAKNV